MDIYRLIFSILSFSVGCISCFLLHSKMGLHPVIASSLVGLVGSFFSYHPKLEDRSIESGIYSGSFAGMTSTVFIQSFTQLFILSFIGSILFYAVHKHFSGYGGKLGTVAFISVTFFIFLHRVL